MKFNFVVVLKNVLYIIEYIELKMRWKTLFWEREREIDAACEHCTWHTTHTTTWCACVCVFSSAPDKRLKMVNNQVSQSVSSGDGGGEYVTSNAIQSSLTLVLLQLVLPQRSIRELNERLCCVWSKRWTAHTGYLLIRCRSLLRYGSHHHFGMQLGRGRRR